jgi:hypothetical protein
MQNHFDAEEAKRRLAHLALMPETTSRRLEMAALRRTLEMAATQSQSKTRVRHAPVGTRIRKKSDVPEKPEKPSREVSRTFEGRKRIVLRQKAPEKKPLKDEDRDDQERMKRVEDFGINLNQGF